MANQLSPETLRIDMDEPLAVKPMPKPPLMRYIGTGPGYSGLCKKCGSSMKIRFFRKNTCIQIECSNYG